MKTRLIALTCWTAAAALAQAQPQPQPQPQPQSSAAPVICPAIAEAAARLACYDNWAKQQGSTPQLAVPVATVPVQAALVQASAASPVAVIELSPTGRVAVQASEITRFWDLEKASARDKFQLRAYRPISLSVVNADQVNTLPSSPSQGSPANAVAYRPTEMKINLSVRTKVATGLLHREDQLLSDSVWFAYSQQSYWQLFNGAISRPFRTTDHEPELIYVFGHARALPAGWTHRMSGFGLVHQSNGQSEPLSRSWNRAYLMAAADKLSPNGDRFTLQAKVWQRLPERAGKDDNPDISGLVGRAELAGTWSFDKGTGKDLTTHTLGLTLRNSLRGQGRGSARLEYLRSLGNTNSSLRFHTQLFTGYGDSLIDYNRSRTVLSLGVSLVDW